MDDVVYIREGLWPIAAEIPNNAKIKASVRVVQTAYGDEVEIHLQYGCTHTKMNNIPEWGQWWCAEDRDCPHHIRNRKVNP